MRMTIGVGLVAVALLAGACAGGPDGGPPPGLEQDGPPRPRVQLFISPGGQPFRAPAAEPYPVAAWFAQADGDRDGKLNRDEFRVDAEAWFKVLDANGDGQVDMPEVTRWEEELVPEITRATLGFAVPGGGRGRNSLDTRRQGAAAFSLINEPHPVRGADADFSMGVSRAEWRAAADRRFGLLDPDGDGTVLLADLRPTPSQRSGPDDDGGRQRRPPIGVRRRN